MLLIKQKQKNVQNDQNEMMKPWNNRNNESAYVNIFPELLLPENFDIIFERMFYHTLEHTLIFIH